MIRNMRSGIPSLLKQGSKSFKGRNDSTLRSIETCIDLSEILQTSFGPNGLHKIIINHLEKITITSDSASIIKDVEVNHPVAKMLVLAAKMQEKEIGDGSNLVIIFAGELCRIAKEMIDDGVDINDIVHGYSFAMDCVQDILNAIKIDQDDQISLQNSNIVEKLIKTAISTKIPGYTDHFASLINLACEPALRRSVEQNLAFNVDDIQVCKISGGSLLDSIVVKGLVVETNLEGIVISAASLFDVKVAAFNGSVDIQSTETKGVVLLENAQQMLDFNTGEEKRMESSIENLAKMGVKLIVTGGAFGDSALYFMVKHGIAGLRISSKFVLQRVVKLMGCNAITIFGEEVTKEDLGFCKKVTTKVIASKKFTFLEQDELDVKISTIVIRGSTENIRDNAQKAVDDGVNTVKIASKDARFVAGGGAAEIELAKRIKKTCENLSDISIKCGVEGFAKALEIIPRILAKSSDVYEHKTVSEMIAAHSEKNEDGSFKEESIYLGVDVDNGKIADMKEKEVFDLLLTKKNALKLATDSVCTLLRIDNIIMAKPAGGPKLGKRPDWDED